jgi:hypothetical protein
LLSSGKLPKLVWRCHYVGFFFGYHNSEPPLTPQKAFDELHFLVVSQPLPLAKKANIKCYLPDDINVLLLYSAASIAHVSMQTEEKLAQKKH